MVYTRHKPVAIRQSWWFCARFSAPPAPRQPRRSPARHRPPGNHRPAAAAQEFRSPYRLPRTPENNAVPVGGRFMKLVVVGNGPTGHHLVTRLRDRDPDGAWDITVLAEETRPAYDRTRLSAYFHGTPAADLTLTPVPGTTLRLGRPAEELDRERRIVITRDGEHRYD